MVIGLAPVFIFWNAPVPKLSFQLSVLCGIVAGLVLAFHLLSKTWVCFDGNYGNLLTINIMGTVLCFVLFFVPIAFKNVRTINH